MYKYGMRLRGFSIGCQPMEGLRAVHDGCHPKYWSVLIYNRKLTDKEVADYELDYIGETDENIFSV